MNVPRRNAVGWVDPDEPKPVQIFITSAGPKTCFYYGKMIELAIMSVIRPQDYYVWGCDYYMAMHYGLIDKSFLEEQKYSSTYSSEAFARRQICATLW